MTNIQLTVGLCGLDLSNPTILASGVLGYTAKSLQKVAESGAGAVTTKSVGLNPRSGYVNPTVVQANCGLINAMGLPNPGVDEFVGEIVQAKLVLKVPLIVSVYGFSVEEYNHVVRKVYDAGADAVELNVSCPHVKETGSEIGQNPKLLREVVRAAKMSTIKPVFVKLSPNVAEIAELAEAAEDSGADAVTAVNTLKAMAIDAESMMPILANKRGGLSGEAVKPIALRSVYDIWERVKIPIIGCGGITTWRDAIEFFLAGASAIQVGTAITHRGVGIFGELVLGISTYLKKKGIRSVNEIVGVSHRR